VAVLKKEKLIKNKSAKNKAFPLIYYISKRGGII